MPRALSQFHVGQTVMAACYKGGCEETRVPVILGKEFLVHRLFTGNGRIYWTVGTPVRGFKGSEYVGCPKCRMYFSSIIIVSNGSFQKPTIFGYDSSD